MSAGGIARLREKKAGLDRLRPLSPRTLEALAAWSGGANRDHTRTGLNPPLRTEPVSAIRAGLVVRVASQIPKTISPMPAR